MVMLERFNFSLLATTLALYYVPGGPLETEHADTVAPLHSVRAATEILHPRSSYYRRNASCRTPKMKHRTAL
jgi:hypothetical protein